MEDRDNLLLEALTSLINANNKQINERFDKLETRIDAMEKTFDQEIRNIKLYIENVLEKKLDAFYDNTVTITEYHTLKKEVDGLKKTIDVFQKKIS